MELTIKNLENCFNGAIENNANYIGIKIQINEIFCSYVITNRKGFGFELDFCKENYNEDLTHKHNKKIKIIGFTYGDTFEDIEKILCNDEDRTNKIDNILEDAKNLILNSKHYSGKIETIDYMKDKLTDEQFEGYLMGNVIKYLSRYNKKDKKYMDLNKAFTYLLWLIQNKREDNNEQAV